ncbi:MAG: 4-hydroxy-3-methylbut-2-enyl diphosphate reductase [Vicinamibacteria bacterium]|jgi:4-hydroxy-3-methylbut-2-enyl diphosphate reductase|nr:4-hydroxy-3-methylbut-2-enyl diphosphate reductase [Vicinamibacteria bacterium]
MANDAYQRGFGLKSVVQPVLEESYHSPLVDRVRAMERGARAGNLTIKLAREFGFCYGVDRAVQYAYETRQRFPERRIYLAGEIIHNPDVNARIESMGILLLREAADPVERYRDVQREDVVILPAFGVTMAEREHLTAKGCVLVDTTCGSVLNVWKSVHQYARDGFTAVIHGKYYHEETRATASQALSHPGGRYLCIKDRQEAQLVCDFIRGQARADELRARFERAASPAFDPERDLLRIGLANQTTMLTSESIEIQDMLRAAMIERVGDARLKECFRVFDTICTATQDRQDAVLAMLAEGGLDLMVVIGGYNSSNTTALARICAERLPTYHIDRADCLGATIRHRIVGDNGERETADWLPAGSVNIGLTAGASTPNSVVGQVIERILALRGQTPDDLQPA